MPTHRSAEEIAELRARAAELRAAGVGAKRIAQQLGISHHLVSELLRGVPVPASLMRLRAKDDLREAAIALRTDGRTYDEIQTELGVSKGSLSLWLRELAHPSEAQRTAIRSGTSEEAPLDVPPDAEIARALRADGWLLREIADELGVSHARIHLWCRGLPVPPRATHGRSPQEARDMNRARWDAELARRDAERREVQEVHGRRVGAMTERDLVEWLRLRDVGIERLRLCVNIHESGDLETASTYWADVVGCAPGDFAGPVIKRHNPRTVRKNTGESYRGCLSIGVRQSRLLYQEIEGLWRGVVRGALGSDQDAAH